MTIAAFFRDARFSNSISHASPSHAGSLLRDFLSNYAVEDCNGAQLLALADLATRSRQHDIARQALARAVSVSSNPHLAHYKLGRVDLAAEDYQGALAHFLAGTEGRPDFPPNWMGAARAAHGVGDTARAAAYAERFAQFGLRPQSKHDLPCLSPLADFLFEAGQRPRALQIYQLLVTCKAASPRDRVRLAECLIQVQRFAQARDALRPLEEDGMLDTPGKRALATCLSHAGDHARATELAEAAMLEQPRNAGLATAYVDVLARSREAPRMEDALLRHAAIFTPAHVTELRARLCLLAGDVAGACAVLESVQFPEQGRLLFLGIETGYAAMQAGLSDAALNLTERLAAAAPDNVPVRMLTVDALFREQEWEQAGAILDALPEAAREHPQVLLKRFEYACFLGTLGTAAALWDRIEALGLASRHFMPPRFRFLAEHKRWNEVIDAALPWLDGGFVYAHGGSVMFRAARQTRRHADLIGAIEAVPAWETRPNLARLRAELALDAAADAAALSELLNDPVVTASPALTAHAETRRRVLARAEPAQKRRALLLCTNATYLCATTVALHTAAKGLDKANTDIFVVIDDDLVDTASRVFAPYTGAGYSIDIVPASRIVDAAEKLYPAYGLFTGGHQLASAAYYRIYAAKYLAELGRHDRAAYMDGDILLRRPLDTLFELDLAGTPLAARREVMRPEVRRAIALHGIENGFYFNSGVLLFDLQNEELTRGIDGAVAAIGDDSTTLLYHDQCALNLGFRHRCAELDKAWNFPIGEATALADIPEDAAVLHFLDRPKPWSASYAGECGVLWWQQWGETAAFLGSKLAVEVFALNQE